MQISLKLGEGAYSSRDLVVIGAFCKKGKKGPIPEFVHQSGPFSKAFQAHGHKAQFDGSKGSCFFFDTHDVRVLIYGLGERKDYNAESLRKATANIFKLSQKSTETLSFDLDSFLLQKDWPKTVGAIGEALIMASYAFDKYKSKQSPKAKLTHVFLDGHKKPNSGAQIKQTLKDAITVAESVNLCRSLVNEPPNYLHSEKYSKMVAKDVEKIPGVRLKVLGKKELKREKMNMFLSVNAGSAYPPQLIHLTYTPPAKAKKKKSVKHIALVGKGITFDTGGISLKPAASIINMKFDMAGSATVYAAFKAAAKLQLPLKISCFLGVTDNAIDRNATLPDSIVTARNGKTVEILNTDAEGRLVLGDCLDYACSHKPDAIIDCATLTGACLVALGNEVCGLMGNDSSLMEQLQSAAKEVDEYLWPLPIIPEWSEDMKSPIADLKNIGGSRFAGTAKAAAFLKEFVGDGVPWAHLDIAGIGDSQKHLPYCPPHGGSGLMVRTLVEFLKNNCA